MSRLINAMLVLCAVTVLAACSGGDPDGHGYDDGAGPGAFATVSKAVCVLSPTSGAELKAVTGTVTFTQTKNGLLVEAEVSGLKPDSKHGFHVHQWGDISATDGTSAGGHYNPGGTDHSLPGGGHAHGDTTVFMTGGHAGDLGNLESDHQGNASYSKTFENISLKGPNAVLGRSIIVHQGEDDGTGASGNAGPRVAQGVIGVANPE